MEKKIKKAVSTKAFETAHVELQQTAGYEIAKAGQVFIITLGGIPCDKFGQAGNKIGEVFTYRNEKLATEALAYFDKCK